MPQKLLHAFLVLFLLLTISCSDQPAPYSVLPPGSTILAFGDSLTAGNGTRKHKSYPAILQKLSGYHVINAGISGEISATGLKRLPSLLNKHRPALVIICHGGNDILKHHNLSKTQSNLVKMIELVDAHSSIAMLMAVPKPSLTLSPPPLYQQVADSTKVIYDADTMATVLGNRELKSDTYHPNAAGYAVIAERIFQQLAELGLIKSKS